MAQSPARTPQVGTTCERTTLKLVPHIVSRSRGRRMLMMSAPTGDDRFPVKRESRRGHAAPRIEAGALVVGRRETVDPDRPERRDAHVAIVVRHHVLSADRPAGEDAGAQVSGHHDVPGDEPPRTNGERPSEVSAVRRIDVGERDPVERQVDVEPAGLEVDVADARASADSPQRVIRAADPARADDRGQSGSQLYFDPETERAPADLGKDDARHDSASFAGGDLP